MVVFDGEKKFTLEVLKYTLYHTDYLCLLTVVVDAYDNNNTWSTREKSFDINVLGQLLADLKQEESFILWIDTIELSFEYIPTEYLLKIVFSSNFHPKGIGYQGKDKKYEMGFYLNESQRNGLIKSIENILKMFPYR